MRTRVSTFCERFIEAGWLLAVVTIPLYFDVYSSRVFEPDKLTLLRSIAVLMVLAWGVRLLDGALAARRHSSATEQPGGWRAFLRTPLVLPTLILAAVYLLATAASVAPRTSLWGSYQRLQGAYTTLSYMVIFALALQVLKRREQLDRLFTVVILASLPISLYGILQHFGLDPLPWGGDVSSRVSGNMGNPIFLAAYLVMVVPVTLARIVRLQTDVGRDLNRRTAWLLGGGYWLVLVLQLVVWASYGLVRGLALGLVIIALLVLLAAYLRRPMARFALLGCYQLILSVQLVCILFTQSRGPWLGLAAGLFVFGMLFIFARRWRRSAFVFTGVALVALAGLLAVNLPGPVMDRFRSLPYVGRLGRIFETDDGTGKVRVLIWEGATQMIVAHPLRTVIGYGPEAMYVAYGPFYPPDLAHYEKRNASPDRSHNETFDALISTGVLGYLAYMFLFGSLFYYGLSWLKLIRSKRQQRFFLACVLVGPLLALGLVYLLDGGWRYAGVGLPLGFVAGVIVYTSVSALSSLGRRESSIEPPPDWQLLVLVGLMAGLVAHFVEIHFGIAVAATRTYFWLYSAALAVVGSRLAGQESALEATVVAEVAAADRRRHPGRAVQRSRHKTGRPQRASISTSAQTRSATPGQAVLPGVVVGLLLVTLIWNYTGNLQDIDSPLKVVWVSLTTMAARGQADKSNLGLLWIIVGTWIVAGWAFVAELVRDGEREQTTKWWVRSLGIGLGVALGVACLYSLSHGTQLVTSSSLTGIVYSFYVWALFLWLGLAIVLYLLATRPAAMGSAWSMLAGAVLLLVGALGINSLNLDPIKADLVYKQGLKYDQASMWSEAIALYGQALDLAPSEDYYWLYYGRGLLESAKTQDSGPARETQFQRALEALTKAHDLNPLNTDHTANLARLYRSWADAETDATAHQEKLDQALQFYAQACALSPNQAQILDEWGQTYYVAGDLAMAEAKYQQSLELDPIYAQTWVMLGDLRMAQSDWPAATEAYSRATQLDDTLVAAWSALGYAYAQAGDLEQAIAANMQVLHLLPQDYNTLKNLALLYAQAGDQQQALAYAQQALPLAPEEHRASLQQFIAQLEENLAQDQGE